MNPRAGTPRAPRNSSPGFSLVELLLAVALLVLLAGAIAFNFSAVQQGAELDEGAQQLESLLRYARAHAANSGHNVRIGFEEDVGDGLTVPVGNLDVTWEPDPLGQPGFYEPLPETAGYVRAILDSISIERVRSPGQSPAPAIAPGDTAQTGQPAEPAEPAANDANAAFAFPPITFYPDGSSDSAEITIALRYDADSARRIEILLNGLTGAIRRRVFLDPASATAPASPDADIDANTAATGSDSSPDAKLDPAAKTAE